MSKAAGNTTPADIESDKRKETNKDPKEIKGME